MSALFTYWFSLKKGNRKNPRSGWLFNGFSAVCSTILQCFYFYNTITILSLFSHIVQSYTYELKRGISFIRFSLSYYNQVYHKTCYFNHWQIISQGLTWYWGHDYEFCAVLHNDKQTWEQSELEHKVRKGWMNDEWRNESAYRCYHQETHRCMSTGITGKWIYRVWSMFWCDQTTSTSKSELPI